LSPEPTTTPPALTAARFADMMGRGWGFGGFDAFILSVRQTYRIHSERRSALVVVSKPFFHRACGAELFPTQAAIHVILKQFQIPGWRGEPAKRLIRNRLRDSLESRKRLGVSRFQRLVTPDR
jgi:hypothetical protein